MNPRLILAVLIALVIILPGAVQGEAQVSAPTPNVGLGFGPASIFPLTQGTPIFTNGDNLWVLDGYVSNVFVTLLSPSGTLVEPVRSAQPGEPLLVHKFGSADQAGIWRLVVTDIMGLNSSVPIRVVAINGPVSPGLPRESLLPGGQLEINFTLGPRDEYAVQACLTALPVPSNATLQLPPAIGSGQLGVQLNDSRVNLAISGAVTTPFDFWMELYHPYSLSVGTGGEVVSQDLKVASTTPFSYQLQSPRSANGLTVVNNLPLRVGRYTLRAYFRTATGLTVQEIPMLREADGHWLWLGGCASLQTVQSNQFSLRMGLNASVVAWPRGAFTMYRVGGIEGYSFENLDLGLSAVMVVGSPWNVTLTQVQARAVGPTVLGSTEMNGTLYVLSSQYPVNATMRVSIGSTNYLNQTLHLGSSYTLGRESVSVGLIDVQAASNGQSKSGVRVVVRTQSNASVTSVTNSTGVAVFALPAGAYSASARLGNVTATAEATVVAGERTQVSLDLSGGSGQLLVDGLAVLAVIGVLANVWVWLRIRRGRIRMDHSPS